MITVYSKKTLDNSHFPLVFSFDVQKNENTQPTFSIGLLEKSGEIHYKLDISTIINEGEYTEDVYSDKFDNERIMIVPEIYPPTQKPKNVKLDTKSNSYIFYSNENDTSYNDINGGKISDGAEILFLVDEPTSKIVTRNKYGYFEPRVDNSEEESSYKLSTNIITIDDETQLLLDYNDNDLIFLQSEYTVTKNYSKENISKFVFNPQDSEDITITQNVNGLLKQDTYRARFILSNKGRNLSFHVYNKTEKKWDCVKTFVFNKKSTDEDKKYIISFGYENATISNITSNF